MFNRTGDSKPATLLDLSNKIGRSDVGRIQQKYTEFWKSFFHSPWDAYKRSDEGRKTPWGRAIVRNAACLRVAANIAAIVASILTLQWETVPGFVLQLGASVGATTVQTYQAYMYYQYYSIGSSAYDGAEASKTCKAQSL